MVIKHYLEEHKNLIYLLYFCVAIILPLLIDKPWISIIFALLIGSYLSFKQDIDTLSFITIVYVFQNLVLIVFSKFLNPLETKALLSIKEIIVYLSVILGILFYKKLKNLSLPDIMAAAFIVLICINFILSNINISAKIASTRQLLIPIICFLFGRVLDINEKNFKKYSVIILYLGIFLAAFSLLELFILKDNFWVNIGMSKFMENKGVSSWGSNGILGSFYTYDYIKITGQATRRVVSIFAETMTSGHFMFFIILYIIYVIKGINKYVKISLLVLLFIPTILCFSKGVYLIVLYSIIIYLYYIKSKKRSISVLAFILIIGIIIFSFLSYGKATSTGYHLRGLMENFKSISIFGYGIGSTGDFAYLFANKNSIIKSSESFIGVLTGQLGFIGLLTYLGFHIAIFKEFIININIYKSKWLVFGFTLISSIFIESILSESAVSFLGTSLYFIFAGLIYQNKKFILNT